MVVVPVRTFVLVILVGSAVFAQENEEQFYRHKFAFMTGYAFVPQTVKITGDKITQILPTLGFDYTYAFSHKWGIGQVNDFEFADYFVRDPREDGNLSPILERKNKYIGAVVVVFEPLPWLLLYAGPGIEIDKHESLTLLKVGVEVARQFEGGWGVGLNGSIDVNEIYQTISLGLIVSTKL